MKSASLWWPFIKQHKAEAAKIIFLGICTSCFSLFLPLCIGRYFEITFGESGGKTRVLQKLGLQLPDSLSGFFILFLSIMLLKLMSAWGYLYYSSLLSESFVTGLRSRYLAYNLKKVPGSGAEKASILIPFGSDIKALHRLLKTGVLGFIKDILFLLLAIFLLYLIQPFLTAVVVLILIMSYCIHRLLSRIYKPLFALKRKRQASLLNHAAGMLQKRHLVQFEEESVFIKKNRELETASKKYHQKKSLLTAITPFMHYQILVAVMLITSLDESPDNPRSGDVIIYILLLTALFPAIRNVIRIGHTWTEGALAARKFIER